MSRPIIEVRNVSKSYRLGAIGATSLKDEVSRLWDRARGRRNGQGRSDQEFWALRDVSFDVQPGELVGIIGRNGAGKSTLLKILSRITQQTSGEITLRGRVASLLEVGTGFHPDLTGLENIFLNGAILGMTKAEIRKKLDEIVAFAEVEQFIDTPVKRYSSGMHVRLAFGVAAHLDPEILLVDEVLAVGDVDFQRKCLGKMSDVASSGRTVLLVSHHMPAITRLCRRCVLLDAGRLIDDGDAVSVTGRYLRSRLGTTAEREWPVPHIAPGDDVARLHRVRVLSGDSVAENVDIRTPVIIEMDYWNLKADGVLLAAVSFFNDHGVLLFASGDWNLPEWGVPRPPGLYRSRCVIPGNVFAEGQVRVLAEVSTRQPMYQTHVLEHDCVAFQVVDTGAPGSVRGNWGRPIPGVMRIDASWQTSQAPTALVSSGVPCR